MKKLRFIFSILLFPISVFSATFGDSFTMSESGEYYNPEIEAILGTSYNLWQLTYYNQNLNGDARMDEVYNGFYNRGDTIYTNSGDLTQFGVLENTSLNNWLTYSYLDANGNGVVQNVNSEMRNKFNDYFAVPIGSALIFLIFALIYLIYKIKHNGKRKN